jgi:hemerythrin-like domain-containing protein
MSANDTPTRILRDQHENILEVANVLERILAPVIVHGSGVDVATLDFDALEDCVAFIRLYADALHHGKEEALLFPEMESRGMPHDAGPIAVMLHEHQQGRSYAKTMADALPQARGGNEQALRTLATAGRGYVELIRAHIMKENHILFEMADQMIDEPACRTLCAAYDGVCRHTFEGKTVAQLEGILERLVERYPQT